MAENGSFRERWQYRQEMKAYGAWGYWGFPTRDDYTQFHDARNLADLVKTWRPNNVEAYGLGEQGLTPLTQADKAEAYALLDKRMESGLSDAEVRAYAQLVNRWQAEHAMLAGGEVPMQARTPAEDEHLSRYEPHRTTEDLGFVLGEPERREITQSEAAAIEARIDVLQERDALVEERVGPLVSPQEGEQWMQALRERLDALMNTAETQAVKQRPEVIADRIADLLEEAQRQGLVVTGQETPPETQALKHK